MRTLQRVLAIPMGLSALAALWLLWRQLGSSGLIGGLGFTFLTLICLRTFGNYQKGKVSRAWGWGSLAVLAFFVADAAYKYSGHPVSSRASNLADESWSEARATTYVSQSKPVFVYFTADWCLTCKVNEAGAIDRAEVRAAFEKAGVKVLAGDWTNGDPAITRFLEAHGRAGVPFYLWYAPGKEPEELPQVLTPSMLISRAQSVPG